MVDKLSKDLNIIQNSDIEVKIDPITADLNIIQKLDDEPNDVGGLTAQELKAKFDEAGNVIKTFINESLIPQVAAETVSEAQRELNEQQRQDNEAQRQANEQVRQANEAEREAAEAARRVWEDYDPAKAYVPGNKVYWAGSSYVNKVPCTGVPPYITENWQMVAKRGETVGDGMTEEDCDERYLQLSGGIMTGSLTTTVPAPTKPGSPVPKWYVTPESISVKKLPDKTAFYIGDMFDPSGMEVEAKYANGDTRRVTGYRCDLGTVSSETEKVNVQYMENHKLCTEELLFSPGLFGPVAGIPTNVEDTSRFCTPVFGGGVWLTSSLDSSALIVRSEDNGRTWEPVIPPIRSAWGPPVYGDGVWIVPPSPGNSINFVLRSEDGGETFESVSLPLSHRWSGPAYGENGEWVMLAAESGGTTDAVYSNDGGKTWSRAYLPSSPASATWMLAGYHDGVWVAIPENVASSIAAYSTNGEKTWASAALPGSYRWNLPVYGDGVWIMTPSSSQTMIVRSEDGKIWKQKTISPANNRQGVAYGGGVWIMASTSNTNTIIDRSEDGGETWTSATIPNSQFVIRPIFGDGKWVLSRNTSNVSSEVFYSEDGGKTWATASLPDSSKWVPPVFGGGVFVAVSGSSSSIAAVSNDGGKTWYALFLPTKVPWKDPAYSNGVWMVSGYDSSERSCVSYMPMYKQLAPLPGQETTPPTPPALPLEDQINALMAETAAITAAIERGMSL